MEKLFIENEHIDPKSDPLEKKFFLPKLLMATGYTKDRSDEMLTNMNSTRQSRCADG